MRRFKKGIKADAAEPEVSYFFILHICLSFQNLHYPQWNPKTLTSDIIFSNLSDFTELSLEPQKTMKQTQPCAHMQWYFATPETDSDCETGWVPFSTRLKIRDLMPSQLECPKLVCVLSSTFNQIHHWCRAVLKHHLHINTSESRQREDFQGILELLCKVLS